MSIHRRTFIAAGAASLMTGAFAQSRPYPDRPIKMVVPFAAGGTTDLVARLLSLPMSVALGQPVTVENRGGAGGALGAEAVARAAPDGYTILLHNSSFSLASVAQSLTKRLSFNPESDLVGVALAVTVPGVVTAHPSVPANDLRELAVLLRSQPQLQYNYGSTGPGGSIHVLMETYKRETNVRIEHIPFKGSAPLKQELLAGRIQLGMDQLSSSLAEINAGTLKPLAIMANRRSPSLPHVPTIREQGFTKMEMENWNGVFVPSGTPLAIRTRLEAEVIAACRHPDVTKRLAEVSAEAVGGSGAEMDTLFRQQMAQFQPLIQELKLE